MISRQVTVIAMVVTARFVTVILECHGYTFRLVARYTPNTVPYLTLPNLKSINLLRATPQIFALSVPLCIGMYDDRNYLRYFTYNYLSC